MPIFKRDDVELYYEEHGTGFPVLLIAPGGMRSAATFWERTPWNPIEQLSPNYRVVAMDQRNAGRSVAPIRATDRWDVYTSDHLACWTTWALTAAMWRGCASVGHTSWA
jgi:pimeloyl-ACP methyl ester carboxylesterase